MLNFDVRPWGSWEEYLNEPEYRVKRLTLLPGNQFSLQRHFKRAEFWTVVQGVGQAQVGDNVREVSVGDVVVVPKGEMHRLFNRGKCPLVIIEVQTGICREDDIERIEDDWGREKSGNISS